MAHPLETLFNIPSNTTTEITVVQPTVEPAPINPSYDDTDSQIVDQLEAIRATAVANAQTLAADIPRVEGKYKALISDAAATMLNVALTAVQHKASLKMQKDRLAATIKKPQQPGVATDGTAVVFADRNEILRMMRSNQPAIDVE